MLRIKLKLIVLLCSLILSCRAVLSKEIALTFDDAPMDTSKHFETNARTDKLIEKLKSLNIPPVIVFANACKRDDPTSVIKQLKKYREAGHRIGNHTCTHPKLDDVGFTKYAGDIEKNEKLLAPLFSDKMFFRYPFLNEGKNEVLRDQMRVWLKKSQYRNGMVSIDNDDYIFSFKINQAKKKGKKIDYKKVEELFLKHLLGAVEFYDNIAVKTLGRSPKHVILLHEMDATVMFVEVFVNELRKRGWKIISAEEAYQDKIYSEQPKNTYANNGIIAQFALEKTGEKIGYGDFEGLKTELDLILGI